MYKAARSDQLMDPLNSFLQKGMDERKNYR